ncbi:MAG: alanine dehydrogenase, partial [Actinomycetota bacterium]
PVYEVGGVLHYAVGNMPGAVPHTSTYALTNATLPYVVTLANDGVRAAMTAHPELIGGISTVAGSVTQPAVAEALHRPFVDPSSALG